MLTKQRLELSIIVLLALAYLLVATALDRLWQALFDTGTLVSLVISLAILVILFGPARKWLQTLAGPSQSEPPTDFQSVLQAYHLGLTRAKLATDSIVDHFLAQVEVSLSPRRTVLFLYEPTVGAYTIHRALGPSISPSVQVRFSPDDALVTWLTEYHQALVLNSTGAQTFPASPIEREELARLAMLGISLIVRLPVDDRLLGWLALGNRTIGQPYLPEELAFLETLSAQTAIVLENARLLESAHRRVTQLNTLNQVSKSITSTLDLDTALHRIMDMAVDILEAEAGSLFLVDDSGQTLTFAVVLGPTGDLLMGATVPMGEGIVGTVAQTSQPLIVNDVHAEPRWNFTFDEATDFHTRDLLCVPMITQNRLIGVIEVVNKRDSDGFDEEDLEILTSFAVQAAIAIVNARRFTSTDQALAEHVQELQLLHTIDRELNSSLDLGRVLDLTLAHALDALDSSTGLIGLLPADGTALYFLASRGLGQNLDQYRELPWSLEQGIIGRVAKTGQAAIVPDVATDPDYVALDPQTRSQLTVPLIRDELVLGVISVTRETQAPFLKKDLEFVRRLAEHAAVAVKNARLFEQANAANEAKTEFMSVASHELKIPMTSIKGYARLLEMGASGDLSEQQRDFLRVIISNVDRMDRLVSDLLDVSRIEAGRIRLTKEQLDLGEVVDEVMRTVETQFQTKQLTLTIDVPPQLPRVWADHGRLIQVMTNLLSNAYKYTPEGGRVQVSASSPNGASAERRLVISVQDTGIGIHSDDRKQIFGKFFRSSDPQVQEVPGTGLGLAITKSLVEMHGGELWFESAEGQGSTFSFSLPTMHPDAPAH